jgi:hypothetical protein
MSKFNTGTTRPAVSSPITTERTPSAITFEGGAGYRRDLKSELFLCAVSNMVGEQTFYESAEARDARYANLVRLTTLDDPEWTARLLAWLRSEGNLRSASLVGAAEYVKMRLDAGLYDGNREVIDSVCQRADEPGEFLAYWTSRYGRNIPKAVKRGVSDAVWRLYTEYNYLKWDSDSKGLRFADVIELVHPTGTLRDSNGRQPIVGTWRGDLYEHVLDRRHGRDNEPPPALQTLTRRAALMAMPTEQRRRWFVSHPKDVGARLAEAGMTWESLAGWLQGPMDAKAWEAIIPSMGYMALLRNLRNFDEAGVSDRVADQVAAKLADPEQVAKSRQFPFRFLSAYEHAPSLRWGHALDKALQHSLRNVPELPGRSLILIDTSASMTRAGLSEKSKVSAAKAAAVFGVALGAKGADVHVTGFASGVFHHEIPKGGSVIREVDRFLKRIGEVGHGTDIGGALRVSYLGHDRVFIISDMQTIDTGVSQWVPAHVPIYGFNLGGYKHAAMATGGTRHEFGGLTDATFRMIPLLEAGRNATWPF